MSPACGTPPFATTVKLVQIAAGSHVQFPLSPFAQHGVTPGGVLARSDGQVSGP